MKLPQIGQKKVDHKPEVNLGPHLSELIQT